MVILPLSYLTITWGVKLPLKVETLIGGLIGVMTTFVFVGWTISAVGRSAQKIVDEVRFDLG